MSEGIRKQCLIKAVNYCLRECQYGRPSNRIGRVCSALSPVGNKACLYDPLFDIYDVLHEAQRLAGKETT